MQLWRFLKPSALPFTLREAGHFAIDALTRAPPRSTRAATFVSEHAKQGDPSDVLRTLDRFARDKRFLMNIGPDKGPLMFELLDRLPRPSRVLELGAFCGYSAIMMTDRLGSEGSLVSIEKDPAAVAATRANLEHAGLAERVELIEGSSSEEIPGLAGPFHLVFLDHWKDLYLEDLQLLEAHGGLAPGSVVVADNVGPIFGAERYLDYVRSCGRYESEHRVTTIEYSEMPDAVEISVYQG